MSENQKEKIIVFDDGSNDSKVLIDATKNDPLAEIEIIPVDQSNLNDIEKYFEKVKVPDKADAPPQKVFLHYSNTHFTELLQEARNPDNTIAREGLDRRIGKIVHGFKDKKGNPRVIVVCPYRDMVQVHVLHRGISAGVLDKSVVEVKETEEETAKEETDTNALGPGPANNTEPTASVGG